MNEARWRCRMTDSISFNPILHQYHLGGRRLDGVTDILEAVLKLKSPWWTDRDKLRGQFVHSVTAAIDDHDWDPALMEFPAGWDEKARQGVINRGLAYQKWVTETQFGSEQSEQIVWSPELNLAGTLDKKGVFKKGPLARYQTVYVEVKSGPPTAAAKLQVMFYQILDELMMDAPMGSMGPSACRVILHLKENGQFAAEYRDDPKDRLDAMALWRVYQYMKREELC